MCLHRIITFLQAAFQALQADPATGTLDADDLMAAMTTEGEVMSQGELEECLNALSGKELQQLYDLIPPQVDAKQFAEEVLGFEDYQRDEPQVVEIASEQS